MKYFLTLSILVFSLSIFSSSILNLSLNIDAVVIDVRTLEEWNQGHLSLASHIEWKDIGNKIQEVAPNKKRQIIIYCRSGNRSTKAKSILLDLGYINVVNAGGLDDAKKLIHDEIVQ